MFESNLEVSEIDKSGAFKQCAELCPDCPRRTGERTVRAKGIKGWLGKKVKETVHYSPLRSGILKSFQTNGRNGIFYGQGGENTGTVAGLREETAAEFVESVSTCEGPTDAGNVCSALGAKSLGVIYDLDRSMEGEIDRLPLADIINSFASDATKVPATDLPTTEVFINNSEPLS